MEPEGSARPGGRRRLALGLAAGIALAAAIALAAILGLGPFGATLTRAELIAEGDAICTRAHEAFEERQATQPRTAGEAATLTAELIEIAEGEHDDLAALRAPAALDGPFAAYLDSHEEGIELLRQGLDAAEAGDAQRYEALQARMARTQQAPRRRLAREVGFERCSRPLVGRAELSRQARRPIGGDLDAPAGDPGP